MEQTMGKRISQNRKRLGLTQDALAEQLGVTAQAVSKWENDQSCPDITMLPRLAEIFGITTDELLGLQNQKIYEAEVVSENSTEDRPKHNWELSWDAGRHTSISFAVLVLLVGALSMASAILKWDVGFWSILWPSALLVFGISGLFKKFSFFSVGCGLFGGYFLIQNLGIWQLEISGEIVIPAIIVLFGISLLVDAVRKPKKPKFRISHNGININGDDSKFQSTLETDVHSFECELCFGKNSHYIEVPLLKEGDISCSFGELAVDLTGCKSVADACEIDASCSFGELTLVVPKRFRVEPDSSTSFASLSIEGQPDVNPQGVIRLDASVSFGEIIIKYV